MVLDIQEKFGKCSKMCVKQEKRGRMFKPVHGISSLLFSPLNY